MRTLSKVRLDPIDGVFTLRAFDEAGVADVPISEEARQYVLVGTVVISGESATISATKGKFPDDARCDFDDLMRQYGVKTVWWERHKRGKTILKKRVIK